MLGLVDGTVRVLPTLILQQHSFVGDSDNLEDFHISFDNILLIPEFPNGCFYFDNRPDVSEQVLSNN